MNAGYEPRLRSLDRTIMCMFEAMTVRWLFCVTDCRISIELSFWQIVGDRRFTIEVSVLFMAFAERRNARWTWLGYKGR